MPTRSYLSQVELPVTFGLGEAAQIDSVTVIWPDGLKQSVPVDGLGLDQAHTIRRASP
jgi:hypothetical protein